MCSSFAVLASGEFIVLHSPHSVEFHGKQELDQSLIKEVFSAALGFTPKKVSSWRAIMKRNQLVLSLLAIIVLSFCTQRGNWTGIYISNPFDLPEAVVGIAIEGVESLDSPRGKKFPLDVDEVEETTWQALSRRLEERDNDNTLVRICVSDGLDAVSSFPLNNLNWLSFSLGQTTILILIFTILYFHINTNTDWKGLNLESEKTFFFSQLGQSALGELKPTSIDETSLKSLSLNNEEDRKYIEDLKLLHAIAKKVPSAITANGKPDVYWLVVSGLRPLIDLHGKDSPSVKEALALLNDALSDISKAFMDAYSDKVTSPFPWKNCLKDRLTPQ